MGSAVWSTRALLEHDAVGVAALLRVDGSDPSAFAADADLRLFGHLHLGDHEADRRIEAGELDAGCLADGAASAVATDEVRGS